MTRNLFKTYAIGEITSFNETRIEFNNDQSVMTSLGIRFNVVLLKKDIIGIIAFGVEEDSENDEILLKRGFNTEG